MRRLVILSYVSILLLAGLSGCLSEGVSTADQADAKQIKNGGRAQAAVFPGEYEFDGRYSQTLAEGTLKPLASLADFLGRALSRIQQTESGAGHRPLSGEYPLVAIPKAQRLSLSRSDFPQGRCFTTPQRRAVAMPR